MPNKRELQVENWNLKYPVGTPVTVRLDRGDLVTTKTTSAAEIMGGHSAVIWLAGVRGCYLLDRVKPTADALPRQSSSPDISIEQEG